MNEISVLYVLCVCSVILSLYPHQTDTEHATVMLAQPTELHGEVSWSTNTLKLHLVTELDNIPKVVACKSHRSNAYSMLFRCENKLKVDLESKNNFNTST